MPVGVRTHKLVLLVRLEHLNAAVLVVLPKIELLLVRILLASRLLGCVTAKVLRIVVTASRNTLTFLERACLVLKTAIVIET